MSVFDGAWRFRGTWRGYQQRVLDEARDHLADGKAHIVAAPGSGKTTLGIELIRRLGMRCLVLSPTITIRQQWLSRVQEDFLDPAADSSMWLSDDLGHPRPMTSITYQALYHAMKGEGGEGASDGANESAATAGDDRRDAVIAALRDAGIGTLCLDEAHHLRTEWHRAVMDVLEALPHLKVVALTATPPYDSTPAQWARYQELCGPIDAEISVPELVCEKSLCPHQDYILLSMPALGECQALLDSFDAAWDFLDELSVDARFINWLRDHPGLNDPLGHSDELLDEPDGFTALLVFAQAIFGSVPPAARRLIGRRGKMPEPSLVWFEALLQGMLFSEAPSFAVDEELRGYVAARVGAIGGIVRGRVDLTTDERARKALAASRSKLLSVARIVDAEYRSLGRSLRLLVLCDHIKKEALGAVGDAGAHLLSLGAVPLFEVIRRMGIAGVRLGMICGSMVIAPAAAAQELQQACALSAPPKPLGDADYAMLPMPAEAHGMVAAMTALFDRGIVNVLVGTKALLGEGWDAPCVNTLVLATHVGSFMQSNQMRGRAIRMQRGNPTKASNIWHLACIPPATWRGWGASAHLGGDFEMLERRFDTFLGISYADDLIVSGLNRLDMPSSIASPLDMEAANERTFERAASRSELAEKWERSLAVAGPHLRVEEAVGEPRGGDPLRFAFANHLLLGLLGFGAFVLSSIWEIMLDLGSQGAMTSDMLIAGFAMICSLAVVTVCAYRVIDLLTPGRRLRRVAAAVVQALKLGGKLDRPAEASLGYSSALPGCASVHLEGGSLRDKALFANAMEELLGPVGNPRYLLKRAGLRPFFDTFSVPSAFGGCKADAELFRRIVGRALGRYRLVYTRMPEGRRTLLKARWRSFGTVNQKLLTRIRFAKGSFT